jgi:glutathione S-transferase
MNDTIFLHHYDASPFSQKAIKMLAIKRAAWKSVIHPMIAPKPALTALTGGYRGTPVMQIGADVYVDSQRIAEELERRIPSPTLYPGGKGIAPMLTDFGDAYFRSGLEIAIKELSPQWDKDFYKDRDAVFPDIEFSEIGARFGDACARLRSQARLIDDQLTDGRHYLMGREPGLADIQVYVVNWFTRAAFPFVKKLHAEFHRLPAWEARMAALGEGAREETAADAAHAAARAATTTTKREIDADDPLGLQLGELVKVSPVTSARGDSAGRLYRLTADEVAIEPTDATIPGVVLHFPRLGYAVARA